MLDTKLKQKTEKKMQRLTRQHFIPSEPRCQDIQKIDRADIGLEIYTYKADDNFCLRIFKGKAQKPYVNFYYNDQLTRENVMNNVIKQATDKIEAKQKAKQTKDELMKDWTNPHKTGDILHTCWGYEQTNIEFYQVVKVNKKSLKLRQITGDCKSTTFMSGTKTPMKDNFIGETITARLSFYIDSGSDRYPKKPELGYDIVSKKVGGNHVSVWNGKPVSYSSYA